MLDAAVGHSVDTRTDIVYLFAQSARCEARRIWCARMGIKICRKSLDLMISGMKLSELFLISYFAVILPFIMSAVF